MPLFYEDAAHILLFLTRAGVLITPGIDCRIVIAHLAKCLHEQDRELRGLSHIAAASMILGDLESLGFVACERKRRTKTLKVLGTALANFQCRHQGLRR